MPQSSLYLLQIQIEKNNSTIASNARGISSNTVSITDLSGTVDTNRASILNNVNSINSITASISSNTAALETESHTIVSTLITNSGLGTNYVPLNGGVTNSTASRAHVFYCPTDGTLDT